MRQTPKLCGVRRVHPCNDGCRHFPVLSGAPGNPVFNHRITKQTAGAKNILRHRRVFLQSLRLKFAAGLRSVSHNRTFSLPRLDQPLFQHFLQHPAHCFLRHLEFPAQFRPGRQAFALRQQSALNLIFQQLIDSLIQYNIVFHAAACLYVRKFHFCLRPTWHLYRIIIIDREYRINLNLTLCNDQPRKSAGPQHHCPVRFRFSGRGM